MKYSQTGLNLTKNFEGCRFSAYLDQTGVPTIGYGHTRGVTLVTSCTQEQADAWLVEDISSSEQCVSNHVKVPLTQGEFDSLVDFTFNLGCGSFSGSTLLRLINSMDYCGAAQEFEKWSHAGVQVVPGLLLRRRAEKQLFESGM